MRGDNHVLAVTVTKDEVTGDVKPLFHFPIQVCKATDEREVKFDIAAPSGGKRKQVYVDEATGEMVEDADCQRGVRVGDAFTPIDPEAIEQINDAAKITTMVALGVEDFENLPMDRSTGTYFVQSPANGGSPKSYRILYEALLPEKGRKAKALVTKRTARTRQKLCAIYADKERGCLMLQELRFASQLKAPDEQILAPQEAVVEAAQVAVAKKVVDNLPDGSIALANEQDEVLPLRQELIEQALAGETLALPTPIAEATKTDDLTAMLEASLDAAGVA